MSGTRRLAVALAAFLALASAPADAHLVQTGFGAFYDGIVHVLLTPAELLLVLALALLAGLRGKEVARTQPFALPAAWLAGVLLGAALPAASTRAWPWIGSASVLLAGALVALDARLSRTALARLGGIALLAHGALSGAAASDGFLSVLGAVAAIFTLVTLCAALVVSLRAGWQRIAVRVAGSWIAAIGILMLAWQAR